MVAVDTNVLLRILVRDDDTQLRKAELFIERGAFVSQLVLAECIWVLDAVYARTKQQIASAIEMLLMHTSLTLQDVEIIGHALELYRTNSRIGFSDCLIVETARRAGHLPLGTFDKRLARLQSVRQL